MKRNSHKKNKIAIIILIIVVCTISVSYATLTKTLTTNYASITQTPLNYETIVMSGNVITDSQYTYKYCGTISVTNDHKITVSGVKMYAGAECKYRIVIKNTSGSGLKSKLTGIEPIYPTGQSNCSTSSSPSYFGCDIPGGSTGRFRYTLSAYSSFSSNLSTGAVINDGSTKTIYLKISNTATEIVANATANGGGFKLTFTAQ